MATAQQHEAAEILGKVDWDLYRDRRVMTLWKVAALSMEMTPTKPFINQAKKNDPNWKAEYNSRKNYLCAKLCETPTEGLVMCFPKHRGGNEGAVRTNLTIDMLSAIPVLRNRYSSDDMAKGFLALEADLKKIPIPPLIGMSPSIHVHVPSGQSIEKPKRDQTARNNATSTSGMHYIVYAMAKLHYNYSGKATATEKSEAIEKMCAAMQSISINGYGAGPDALKNILIDAHNAVINKNLPE
ncbi:MAG: hypothetical protein JWQ21_581 [Herminiimonas sp.]|nr:hypothetical protein [Herminiimonas sp.]